jgi:hypothetical protein
VVVSIKQMIEPLFVRFTVDRALPSKGLTHAERIVRLNMAGALFVSANLLTAVKYFSAATPEDPDHACLASCRLRAAPKAAAPAPLGHETGTSDDLRDEMRALEASRPYC